MTRVYLASGFNRAGNLRILAAKLSAVGIQVMSTWIWTDKRPDRNSPEWPEFARKIAGQNLIDLMMSNTLIIDGYGIKEDNNGGVHTELGWAIAKDWPIYLIGDCNNTFSYLPNIIKVPEEDEVVNIIQTSPRRLWVLS